MNTQIHYDYAFAAPHRITLSRPEGSWKTLCDITSAGICMKWSYECLKDFELNIWRAPTIDWGVTLSTHVNGKHVPFASWKRLDGYLPGFCCISEADGVRCTIKGISGMQGDVLRAVWQNNSGSEAEVSILADHDRGGWIISNPAWIDGSNPNTLLCMQNQRPHRILIAGFGADSYPIAIGDQTDQARETPMAVSNIKASNPGKSMTMEAKIAPGEERIFYLFRAYNMDKKEMPALNATDWQAEFEVGKQEWIDRLSQATAYHLPDKGVEKALYACLSDIFVMSEFDNFGHRVTAPGSDVYRSPNSGDGLIATDALAKYGYFQEAREKQVVHLEDQDEDGNWNDPFSWGHHGLLGAYFKAQTVMRYYHLTGDLAYLREHYPRMKAASLWQEKMRATTRNDPDPLLRGLLPRCMGDCGLWNGGDYFGVFYPHNMYCIYADRMACEAAEILGDPDLPTLRANHDRAREELRASLHAGYIVEKGFPIIPNVPRKPGGSTFGMLTSTFPCGVLDADDPLALGCLNYVESSISDGGQPVGNGWMPDGCWVAISLDNLAETKLGYGDADAAAGYFLSALNYASPLITWPEERGKDAGSEKVSGDRQHVWTPSMICHYLHDAITRDRDGVLQLLEAVPRTWLAVGEEISAESVHTGHGRMNLLVRRSDAETLEMEIESFDPERRGEMRLHLRVPERNMIAAGVEMQGGTAEADGDSVNLRMTQNACRLTVHLKARD